MNNVLDFLESSAKRAPKKTAVVDMCGSQSYEELVNASKRIGSGLLRYTKGSIVPVPILMEKGIPALQAFFGAVYAGCFYVLLNPELPEVRLKHILDVLEAELVVTDHDHEAQARELATGCGNLRVVRCEELLASQADEERLAAVRKARVDTDPLYANFTSGSTGIPKGVLVGHSSVIDFIECFAEEFAIDETDVIANQAPFDFDVSVKDIYSAIRCGATLLIVPRQFFSNPAKLMDFICDHSATTLIWAVSALCLVSTFHGLDYRKPESVKRVLFSGEVMPQKHLNIWMEALPRVQFVNLYGPTEITCNCTYHVIDRTRKYDKGIPIGRPFYNERVFLLSDGDDGRGKDSSGICSGITSPGVIGEICVGGRALAIGYYGNWEQTNSRFVQNPLNKKYYERIYRTGDLGYYDEDGDLMFAGRKDFQIKHMGHRIELEEIERALMDVDGVIRACCIFDEEKDRLYGFCVGETEPAALKQILAEGLPEYMIPRRIILLEDMPITKNGKLDRKALAEMAKSRGR